MNKISEKLLKNFLIKIKDNDAFNIREDGKSIDRNNSKEITITSKTNKSGIDIKVEKNSIGKVLHIPVIVTKEGFKDVVYNDFYIGDNSIVTIYAGCIVNNDCKECSSHKGIHTFHLSKNSKVKYIEEHYGYGEKTNNKIIDTDTIIYGEKDSIFIMKTIQNRVVDKANRNTVATLNNNSILDVNEKLLTGNNETVTSSFKVNLDGKNSRCNIISKAVSKDNSSQKFNSQIIGNNECVGHVECDAIMMDKSKVLSTPSIEANDTNATLTHEAAIGKIAKDEIIKLMTLGLSSKEAKDTIIKGFID